ncbi:hypothetical protein PVT67_08905 [Gallaecimonas kandeliae]|uniref:hypothetical protein n=1 Tax=Gallaecimonas kandeliae TaxID=3029055 RepID=UPI00264823F5|nr:hypothetical protein [Gallaecimonas kandeliae]WKE67332.1 hypothetical protein PVT67_08905 [Gallaecimonas kandeliae]
MRRNAIILMLLSSAPALAAPLPCDFSQGPCQRDGATLALGPLPLRSMTPIQVQLSLPGQQQAELLGKIEGLSMYMGEVPVLLKKGEGDGYQGQFQLARCSHGAMRWVLEVQGRRFAFTMDAD